MFSRRAAVVTLIAQQEEAENAVALEAWLEGITGAIPRGIFDALSGIHTGRFSYAQMTANYNAKQWAAARCIMADVEPGLKHHELHSLSIHPSSFHLICGLSFAQFGRLFVSVLPPLRIAFPRCKDTLAPGELSNAGSRRLKLFLCLYRLKLAVTFRHIQETFGWCSSAVSEWFDKVLFILHVHLKCYHVGFLQMKGMQWQHQEVAAWMLKHSQDAQTFRTKVLDQNTKQAASNPNQPETINPLTYLAPLGAVDGTYSVCPAVSAAQLAAYGESAATDRMYTDYKKVHGYKLVALVSFGITDGKKYIIYLTHGCARPSDGAVYLVIVPPLKKLVIPQAVFLGDAAFHAAPLVISPYTALETQGPSAAAAARKKFNHVHSSDRMVSEHGMRYLKMWGAVRGRDDCRLFERDDTVLRVFQVVWALHNYVQDDCPVFTAVL